MTEVDGRINSLEQAVVQMRDTVQANASETNRKVDSLAAATNAKLDRITDSLQILARLDARYEHVIERLGDGSKTMESLRNRTDALERAMPERLEARLIEAERKSDASYEARGWLIKAAIGVGSLIGTALIGLVITQTPWKP